MDRGAWRLDTAKATERTRKGLLYELQKIKQGKHLAQCMPCWQTVNVSSCS